MIRHLITIILLTQILSVSGQSTIEWTNVKLLVIDGATLKKTAEKTDWISGAISKENSFSDCWIQFKFLIPKYAVMGLSSYNTSVSVASIDYGIYAHINNRAYVYENNIRRVYPGTSTYVSVPYTANDVFRVERKNGVVYYKKNDAIFYTSLVPSNGSLHADCAFNQHRAEITVTGYMFGLVWTGAVNEAWDEPGNWNLNRVPTIDDEVIINTCTTCPKLSNAVSVAALQLNTGSKIELEGNTLTVGIATAINGSSVESNEGKIQSVDFAEIKNSEFKGIVILEKTGGSVNNCYGGNKFSPELQIVNSSANVWQVATQSDNVIKTF